MVVLAEFGLRPPWVVRLCWFSSDLERNPSPQAVHGYGWSPVCNLIVARRSREWMRTYGSSVETHELDKNKIKKIFSLIRWMGLSGGSQQSRLTITQKSDWQSERVEFSRFAKWFVNFGMSIELEKFWFEFYRETHFRLFLTYYLGDGFLGGDFWIPQNSKYLMCDVKWCC